MTPLDDCCTTCWHCGLVYCMDQRPSPGEPHTCDDCFDLSQRLHGWGEEDAA